MDTIKVQLPSKLFRRVQKEIPSNETLNRIVTDAINIWLDRRMVDRKDNSDILEFLRRAGVVMTSKRQRAFTKATIATLPVKDAPDRAHVTISLAKLKVPLSEEIIAMRGER